MSPENDSSPHVIIESGNQWLMEFETMDLAGTYWYHPNLHEKNFQQVLVGAASLIITRDKEKSKLLLPRSYCIDDFPLIFEFQTFDSLTKQILIQNDFDNITMINGCIEPILNCPAQFIRFCLLNSSNRRILSLGF